VEVQSVIIMKFMDQYTICYIVVLDVSWKIEMRQN